MARSRSLGSRRVMSRPSIFTEPESGSSRPAITRSSVDLPQPDGPSSTTNSPSRAVSERRSTAVFEPKRLVMPSIVNPRGSGACASAKGLLLALLYFLRRRIFHVRRNGPGEAEGILHVAVAVAPELIGQRKDDRAAGGYGFLEAGVDVRHVQAQHDRPIPLGGRRAAELREMVGEHEHGIADLDCGVHQLAARSRGPADLGCAERLRTK